MSFANLMDIAILVLLATTVAVGFKLTLSLRNFRESRFEMEGLLNRLTSNIERAENAISGLQNAAKNSGVSLQAIINDSKSLGDELHFMNEAGNNLASRLEKLAERNRELVEQVEAAGGVGPQQIQYQTQPPVEEIDEYEDELDQFLIQDHDFTRGDDDYVLDDTVPPLQSQAERELFEALSRNKRKSAAGRA